MQPAGEDKRTPPGSTHGAGKSYYRPRPPRYAKSIYVIPNHLPQDTSLSTLNSNQLCEHYQEWLQHLENILAQKSSEYKQAIQKKNDENRQLLQQFEAQLKEERECKNAEMRRASRLATKVKALGKNIETNQALGLEAYETIQAHRSSLQDVKLMLRKAVMEQNCLRGALSQAHTDTETMALRLRQTIDHLDANREKLKRAELANHVLIHENSKVRGENSSLQFDFSTMNSAFDDLARKNTELERLVEKLQGDLEDSALQMIHSRTIMLCNHPSLKMELQHNGKHHKKWPAWLPHMIQRVTRPLQIAVAERSHFVILCAVLTCLIIVLSKISGEAVDDGSQGKGKNSWRVFELPVET